MNKLFSRMALLLLSVLILHCGTNAGTEVGNPGKRNIAGTILIPSNSINLKTAVSELSTASCTDSSAVSVVLVDYQNNTEVTVDASNLGEFLGEINDDSRYEVHFQQNGVDCGQLYYDDDTRWAGSLVLLGKGTLDIDLGTVTDEGDGVFVSENNPSTYCDDDGDGESDEDDNDVDDDGLEDDDDLSNTGYPVWYDDDDDD